VYSTQHSALSTCGVRATRALCALLVALSCPPAAWPQAASTTGQTGLINMPDARLAPDGTLRFGYGFAEPYPALWTSITMLPRL